MKKQNNKLIYVLLAVLFILTLGGQMGIGMYDVCRGRYEQKELILSVEKPFLIPEQFGYWNITLLVQDKEYDQWCANYYEWELKNPGE